MFSLTMTASPGAPPGFLALGFGKWFPPRALPVASNVLVDPSTVLYWCLLNQFPSAQVALPIPPRIKPMDLYAQVFPIVGSFPLAGTEGLEIHVR